MPDNKSISVAQKKQTFGGRGVMIAFFSLFLAFGLGFSYFFLFQPVALVLQARDWVEIPCVVVSSKVKRHRGSDGPTYSVEIVYKYEVDGREFEADRYHFMGGSSSGRAGKQKIVDQYPPGKEATCYVNPEDPRQAVIYRDFTLDMLVGLVPLLFVLIGGGGLWVTLLKKETAAEANSWKPDLEDFSSTSTWKHETARPGAVVLKPEGSRLANFLGLVVFALFWNGVTSVFVWQAVEGHVQGRPDWFLTVFMTPFVLVGLGTIGGVGYTFLNLLSPKPTLTLNAGRASLGEVLELNWKFSRSGAIRHLKIQLEAKEQATYRRGTTTHTDEETFYEQPLIDTTDPLEIAGGRVEFTIPADSMHSFEGDNNKIVWGVHLTGEIGWWPDLDETYALVVWPRSLSR